LDAAEAAEVVVAVAEAAVAGAHAEAEAHAAEAERPGEAVEGDNVGADLAAKVAMLSPAAGVEEAHVPAEAGEVARDRVAPAPVVVLAVAADFVAELPAALEGAEALAAAREVELGVEIDRQRCHLAAMSLETDPVEVEIVRVASVDQVESGTVRAASVGRVESGIVRAASVGQEVLRIDLVASVGRVESGTVRAASADQEVLQIGRVASVDRAESGIVRAASVDQVVSEIGPVDPEESRIGQAWEAQLALVLGPVSEQDSRIDPELATAHSSEIALGTPATDSAIVLISRTTAVIASKIVVTVLKTVRTTAVTASRIAVIALKTVRRTAATDLKMRVIGLRTGAIG
jgi:hypothetical protein